MSRLRPLLAPLVIFLLSVVAYLPTVRNGFVWDDTALVLRDPLIRSWQLIPEGFRHFLFLDATASDFYRPMQRTSYVADYALFGFAPWGWHLHSLLLHAAAAVLLWLLFSMLADRMLGRPAPRTAFCAAALWAVHPLHSSAVAYVAGRADSLAALFGFTAIVCALRATPQVGRLNSRWTTAAALAFLATLLSKESAAFFPLAWIGLLIFLPGDRRLVRRWAVVAGLVLAAYLPLRFAAEHHPPPVRPAAPFAARLIVSARAIAEYGQLLVFPNPLRMERDVRDAAIADLSSRRLKTLCGLLALAGLVLFWKLANSPLTRAALLMAGIFYLPASGLFVLNATVAEHWLYIPSAFLLLAFVSTVESWADRSKISARFAAGTFAMLIAALLTRTLLRLPDWHDQRTFLSTTIADGGDTVRMQLNLANLDVTEGRTAEGLKRLETLLERSPDFAAAWLGLAAASIRSGDLERARTALLRVESDPAYRVQALEMQALLASRSGTESPLPLLAKAAEIEPWNWPIRKRHLLLLAEMGEPQKALGQLTEILNEAPYRAESWAILGKLALSLGRQDSAKTAFQNATAFDVRDAASEKTLRSLE